MGIEEDFYIQQIETTKEIIRHFSQTDEFSPTMLINSLLSLVVLPYEKAKKTNGKRIFPGKYTELTHKLGFSPDVFQPIKSCNGEDPKAANKTIYSYINKFRNGIAHQNLEIHVDKDRVIWIAIFNLFSCSNCKGCKTKKCTEKGLKKRGNGVMDFQITVTVEQLQKIALYIADSYLKATQGRK